MRPRFLRYLTKEWVLLSIMLGTIALVMFSFRTVLPINPNSYSLTELKERGNLKFDFLIPIKAIEKSKVYSPEYYAYIYSGLNPNSGFVQHSYVQYFLNILSVIFVYLTCKELYKNRFISLLVSWFFGTSEFILITTRESYKPFSILLFATLFVYSLVKFDPSKYKSLYFLLCSSMLVVVINLYPIGLALLPLYFFYFSKRFKDLPTSSKVIFAIVLTAIVGELWYWGVIDTELGHKILLIKENGNNTQVPLLLKKFFTALLPTNPSFTLFLKQLNLNQFMLWRYFLSAIFTLTFIIGLIISVLNKKLFPFLGYLTPFAIFLIFGDAPDRYFSLTFIFFSLLLGYGLLYVYTQSKGRTGFMIASAILIVVISSNSLFSFYLLSSADRSGFLFTSIGAEHIQLDPIYRVIEECKRKHCWVFDLSHLNLLGRLWIKESVNYSPSEIMFYKPPRNNSKPFFSAEALKGSILLNNTKVTLPSFLHIKNAKIILPFNSGYLVFNIIPNFFDAIKNKEFSLILNASTIKDSPGRCYFINITQSNFSYGINSSVPITLNLILLTKEASWIKSYCANALS